MANLPNNNAQLAALMQILLSAQGNKGYGGGYGRGAMPWLPKVSADMQFDVNKFAEKMKGSSTPDPNAPIAPNQPVDVNNMTQKEKKSFFENLFNRDVWKGSSIGVGF